MKEPGNDLAERKVVELRQKLAGIAGEFDEWLEDAKQGKPLRKHHSQIARLTDQLRGMADAVGRRIDILSFDDDQILTECRTLQAQMLEVHRLWDYFRSKLNLRYISWFNRYLAIADEFAWVCYRPAKEAADSITTTALRGAPLVFLSGDFSPFTYARRRAFEVEDIPGTLDSEEFRNFLGALPIPVIGVPWYQVSHLPDAVLVAHEVAHDVEEDCGLTTATAAHLEPALEGLSPGKQQAWNTWLGEVWADLYGVLAAGPAYASAMMDLLVTDPVQVAAEARTPSAWDPHPPASLRVRLMTRALESTGFPAEAADQWENWQELFGTDTSQPLFEVATKVVQTLLSGRYPELGDRTLGELLSFSAAQQKAAEATKGAALADLSPQSSDIRCLVAGARLAFDSDPVGYASVQNGRVGTEERIMSRALEVIGDAPRATVEERTVTPADDRQAGEALFDRLEKLASRTT